MTLSVNEDEGKELAEVYKVGVTYPVFILTDSLGNTVNRWVGYTGGAKALVNMLNRALEDPATIDERIARFNANPTTFEALFLAGYYSGIGENMRAVEYYRKAIGLSKGTGFDYSYKIFENIANAVWDDKIPFDEVIPAADAVLGTGRNKNDIINVARLMTRLAVKASRLDILEKYLKAGIAASAGSKDKKSRETYTGLRADYALYITGDTSRAISIKKSSMDPGWDQNRDQFYMFAKWCLIRKINLAEAEMYVRKAVDLVYPGKYRARVYSTLADILEAEGKIEEAVNTVNMAIEQDRENDYYPEQLKRIQEGS